MNAKNEINAATGVIQFIFAVPKLKNVSNPARAKATTKNNGLVALWNFSLNKNINITVNKQIITILPALSKRKKIPAKSALIPTET